MQSDPERTAPTPREPDRRQEGAETPAEDAAEQRTDLTPGEERDPAAPASFEADEGDRAEQSREVPEDEVDERR